MVNTEYNIVIVSPSGYQFSETFREIAETLFFGLRRLGYASGIGQRLKPDACNIILGAHLLDETEALSLPANSIVYNFEQVHGASQWIKPIYVNLIGRFKVWDYSERNIAMWKRYCPAANVAHVPLGYVPELTRISPAEEEDIDVLFYGVINERRAKVLDQLYAAGLNVHAVTGVFGAERDALIARAKVVLNIHFFETKIFEFARVSYLLANRKLVVSECGADTEIDDEMRESVAASSYETLAEKCEELVYDDVLRKQIASRGFEIFKSRDESAFLAKAVLTPPVAGLAASAELPRRINIGSGKGWDLEALNLDIDPIWGPDVVADLNRPLPPEGLVDLGRFGVRELPCGYFHEIYASHVLEHVSDLVTAMESFLRLLAEGGVLIAEVPYDLSYGAWQDPTHVRALNERSWLYYTEWFWYLGWTEFRFHVDELQFVMSEYGQALTAAGEVPEEVLRLPRAVDAMRVRLRKVPLSVEEKRRGKERWRT